MDGWMDGKWRWQTAHAEKSRICSRKGAETVEEGCNAFVFSCAGVETLMWSTLFVGLRSIDLSNSTRLPELNGMNNT